MSDPASKSEGLMVGITGTLSSGKDTLAIHLQKQHDIFPVPTGNILRAEAQMLGLDLSRPTLIEIGNSLRADNGQGYLCLRGLERWYWYRKHEKKYAGGVAFSALRTVGEGLALRETAKNLGMKCRLMFADGPREVRFQHSQEREYEYPGSTFDTLEEFIMHEKRELKGAYGSGGPNLEGLKEISDGILWNDGDEQQFLNEAEISLGLPLTRSILP